MRRTAGFLLAFALLTGGAAACGSSSGGSDGKTDTTTASAGNTDSTNADVQAYCKAVDAYVKKAKEILADPSKGDAASLQAEGTKLSQKAQALTSKGLSAADGKAIGECSARSASALTPG